MFIFIVIGYYFELVFLLVLFFFAGNMANLCERCKHAMSAHDNHASCPQCRVAAGECSVDPENPCTTCEGWTRKQWARLRRSLIDARARAGQRGKQHWLTAFPRVEAWILAKPVSTSASEISSQAGEGDFDDEILVDTPKQHEVQVLVVHTQNGANMATSSTSTAAGTTITAQSTAASTAALQLAGPSTKEPIVEQLGQDTPSVIQGAHPEQRYGSQPYFFRSAVYRTRYGCPAVYCGTPAVQCGYPAVHCGCPAVHCTL